MKNKKFRFGLEIECGKTVRIDYNDYYNNRSDFRNSFSKLFKSKFKNWTIDDDGTVNFSCSFEFQSPILNIKDLDKVKEVLSLLKKNSIKVNNSCGLHVHVDTPTELEAKKLSLLYSILQKQINKIAKRVYNEYCRQTKIGEIIDFDYRSNDTYYRQHDKKYMSVNILPLKWKKKNIEFRQHYATLNFNIMRRWILFLRNLKRKSDKSSLKQIVSIYCMTEKQKEKIFKDLLKGTKWHQQS